MTRSVVSSMALTSQKDGVKDVELRVEMDGVDPRSESRRGWRVKKCRKVDQLFVLISFPVI